MYWKRCYLSKWSQKLPILSEAENQFSHIVKYQGVSSPKGNFDKTSLVLKETIKTCAVKVGEELLVKGGQKRTWKKCFCEMHVKDYLKNLRPEEYNPEKVIVLRVWSNKKRKTKLQFQIKATCDLFGPYVESLKIDEMKSSENSSNKIPLNAVITGFPHLTELSLRFKQVRLNYRVVTKSFISSKSNSELRK